ncbi:ATP-binding protein [Tolypothrix bouteillei VB521301_2]|uniref:ATP-binding protein n=1 Tax=Tolypothrix bouteillei TaxID=1246981 RepID=UPI0038B596FF
MSLRIQDNGRGFDADSASVSNGYGLLGMRERAQQMGAELTIRSHPGEGTEVVVLVSG